MMAAPVHACFETRGLPRPWDAANDGRWLHVGHGHPFAYTIEQVTCAACLSYIDQDRPEAPPSGGAIDDD
jgi:hypothetical protein